LTFVYYFPLAAFECVGVINNTRGCTSMHAVSLRHPHAAGQREWVRGREMFYFVFDKVRAAVCLFMVMCGVVCVPRVYVRRCVWAVWRLEHFVCVLLASTPTSLLGGRLRFNFIPVTIRIKWVHCIRSKVRKLLNPWSKKILKKYFLLNPFAQDFNLHWNRYIVIFR